MEQIIDAICIDANTTRCITRFGHLIGDSLCVVALVSLHDSVIVVAEWCCLAYRLFRENAKPILEWLEHVGETSFGNSLRLTIFNLICDCFLSHSYHWRGAHLFYCVLQDILTWLALHQKTGCVSPPAMLKVTEIRVFWGARCHPNKTIDSIRLLELK